MTLLEREIEAKLRREIKKLGGFCLKWTCPGFSGVPDRIILLPGGRVYFVETKRPKGGELSKLQKKWQAWIAHLGFPCCVVWAAEDLEFLLYTIRTTKGERAT
jgi:hypothetical protein